MQTEITLVEDVVSKRVPFDGEQLVIEEMPEMPLTPSKEEMDKVLSERVKRHRTKVHKFCGGPFGPHGVKIAFGPAVETKLGLPLQCLSDSLQDQERRILELEENNSRLREVVSQYERAGFWERLKRLFAGNV